MFAKGISEEDDMIWETADDEDIYDISQSWL